jgi:hypothetical protein
MVARVLRDQWPTSSCVRVFLERARVLRVCAYLCAPRAYRPTTTTPTKAHTKIKKKQVVINTDAIYTRMSSE